MQPWLNKASETTSHSQSSHQPLSSQHGLLEHDDLPGSQLWRAGSEGAESAVPDSASSGRVSPSLSDRPSHGHARRGLKGEPLSGEGIRHRFEGHENAISRTPPRKGSDATFQIVSKAQGSADDSRNLLDLPNEILTHILSHLTPTALSATALVSHRLHGLVTTPHAWRVAFSRYFPGQDPLGPLKQSDDGDPVSVARQFTRLTSLASWRSEYILRTRLLRSVGRGKPSEALISGARGSARSNTSSGSAHLSFNSNLLTLVNKIHANFGSGLNKRVPRFVHGATDTGCASSSDPVNHSRVDAWGSSDPQSFLQFDIRFPGDAQYGLGPGEVVGVPNSMDVSQTFGMVVGEGCPAGGTYFRHPQEQRGRFLAPPQEVGFPELGIPQMPRIRDTICSVWIAKTADVVDISEGLVAILSGTSMGIVNAYSAGTDGLTGRRLERGEVTIRWVLSPGVPIIALAIDDKYSPRRRGQRRIWAVALNALGEVFYLADIPRRPHTPKAQLTVEELEKLAWQTGRTVQWKLVEQTRRRPAEDPYGLSDVDGAYSPRSSCDKMNLTASELAKETREIEQFMRYQPKHFQSVCQGWDMRRRVEIDFAGDDEQGAGEAIAIFECGFTDSLGPNARRLTRQKLQKTDGSPVLEPLSLEEPSGADAQQDSMHTGTAEDPDQWLTSQFSFGSSSFEILAIALDGSTYANLTVEEDPLLSLTASHNSSPWSTPNGEMPQPANPAGVPGQRARFVAAGTNRGQIFVWNIRGSQATDPSIINELHPVRVIQTDSPEISCLALTALYLVHGGNDGLVQAWDTLASSPQPIRTLNSRFSSRARRRLVQAQASPWGVGMNLFAAGAICLDPDPTSLRGMVTLGTHLRYWSYSSSAVDQLKKSKRRLRRGERGSNHGTEGGFAASGRGALKSYIEDERREMEREKTERNKERARLEGRFGVGLLGPGATEEELLAYATVLSQEEAERSEEERRKQEREVDESHERPSTPEPVENSNADDFEREIEEAIRLSLREGEPAYSSSPDIPIRITKNKRKQRRSLTNSPPNAAAGSSRAAEASDLDFALQLSRAEEQSRYEAQQFAVDDDFPALSQTSSEGSMKGKGKGKGKAR